jgi:hypothetical protein
MNVFQEMGVNWRKLLSVERKLRAGIRVVYIVEKHDTGRPRSQVIGHTGWKAKPVFGLNKRRL